MTRASFVATGGGCFCVGAILYPLIELLFRGHSHWSMALAGGLALSGLWLVEWRWPQLSLYWKCLLGCLLITVLEFCFGLWFNLHLGLAVWSYAHLPLNVLGQVCLAFCGLWFLLCIPVCAALERVQLWLCANAVE